MVIWLKSPSKIRYRIFQLRCDIVRCAVVLDDPYAMAVFVAYLERTFDVVRIKNRFENDEVEEVSAHG